jgi:CRP-like cAMP-binding protein
MLSVHLRKLRQRTALSGDEQRAIEASVSEVRTVPAHQVVVRAGETLKTSLLLLEGWTARTSDLASGERQITELHVAGDFVDLHGFTLKHLDHDLRTFTPCRFAVVPHERLERMLTQHPRLARLYWFLTNIDAAIHREWVLSLGQRSALSHMAHLFCEMRLRLEQIGLVEDDQFAFPLTQREVAECLGLTTVHANRTVQELRRRKLIVFAERKVRILDRPRLEALAEFEPRYLYLEKRDF